MARVGGLIKLVLAAQTGSKIASLPIQLGYDPSVLQVVDVAEGDYLKQNNAQTVFSSNVDTGSGQITINMSRPGPDAVPGKGILAVVTFKAIAAKPQSQITVSTSNAVDVAGEALPVTPPAPHNITLMP